MVITIRKRPIHIVLFELTLLAICFGRLFTDIFGLPSLIRYSSDFLILMILGCVIKKFCCEKVCFSKDEKRILLALLVIMMIYIASSIVEKPPLLLMLWGIRNTLKGYIFFGSSIILLKKEDIDKILKKINFIFLINVLFCLIEFFVLDLEGDYIGGTFGTEQGCNAYLNVLLIVVTVWNTLEYAEKEQGIWQTVFYVVLCTAVAGMAELKVYVVEVLIILGAIGAFSKRIYKKILLGIAGCLFAILCIRFIENFVPGWEDFFTWENMIETVTSDEGYTNKGDLNRFTALKTLNERIFHGDTNWFGIGLGNAEYSDNFEVLNSEFYYRYKELNYGWFSIAKTYIELGYFGILSMVYIWIDSAIVGIKGVKRSAGHRRLNCKMAVVIAILTPMLFVYNATMHMETSCLICFFMALGYIMMKDEENDMQEETILNTH